jgi:NTE family protein
MQADLSWKHLMNEPERNIHRALILSGGGARGAYQVGVWRYLQEVGWQPDLVCGTSIGSVNGAMIGMGWDADRMSGVWESLQRKQAFRVSFWRRLKYRIDTWRGRHPRFPAYLDNQPLQELLTSGVDEPRLQDLSPEVLVTATNVRRAELEYFSGHQLTARHILASCSIPVVFPWQEIDGELYWDGGVMENTPILPALMRGAREIIVVLLAPLTAEPTPAPRTTTEALAWTMDIITIGSAKALRTQLAHHMGKDTREIADTMSSLNYVEFGGARISVVAPRQASSLKSILDLNPSEARARIESGYQDARKQLSAFIDKATEPGGTD